MLIGLCTEAFYLRVRPSDVQTLYANVAVLMQHYEGDLAGYLHFCVEAQDFGGKYDEVLRRIDTIEPRALWMTKWTTLLYHLTGSAWLNGMLMSAWAAWAAWRLSWRVIGRWPGREAAVLLVLGCWPSALAFGGGNLKEGVLAVALYLLACQVLDLLPPGRVGRSWYRLCADTALSLLLCWVLWRLKYYYFATFVPMSVAWLVVAWWHHRWPLRPVQALGLLAFGCCAGLVAGSASHPNLHLRYLLNAIQVNHLNMVEATTDPANLLHIHLPDASPLTFVRQIPVAMIEGILRPWPWESGFWKKMAALELLAWLGVWWSWWHRRPQCYRTEDLLAATVVLAWTLSCVLLLAYASPNIGNLIRYRTIALSIGLCVPAIGHRNG